MDVKKFMAGDFCCRCLDVVRGNEERRNCAAGKIESFQGTSNFEKDKDFMYYIIAPHASNFTHGTYGKIWSSERTTKRL